MNSEPNGILLTVVIFALAVVIMIIDLRWKRG